MKKLILSVTARQLVLAGLGVTATALFSGCADAVGDQPVDRTAMLASGDQVSSVPWNKPQGWENKSQLGSLASDPRIGGQQ